MATGKEACTTAASVSRDVSPESYQRFTKFWDIVGVGREIQPQHNVEDSFSNLIGGVLKVKSIELGKITCLFNVKAPILNGYGALHGAAAAALAERVAIACVRTVVGKDKDIFLGEQTISYLSAAPPNAEVVIDGSVVRSGRNVTVVAINFQLKESGRLAVMSRATFFNKPASSL